VQNDIARFWTTTGPTFHVPLGRSVTVQPGRAATRHAFVHCDPQWQSGRKRRTEGRANQA
jgi:hypothetical protein